MFHLRILVLAVLAYLACGSIFELNLSMKSNHDVGLSAKRSVRNKRSTVDDVNSYFLADVAVGTPPQRFSLALKLDTAAFSVPDKSCIYLPDDGCPSYCKASLFCKALCPSVCCDAASLPPPQPNIICEYAVLVSDCGSRRKFDRSKSSTYVPCTDCSWGCDHGKVTEEFFQGIDTIRINDGSGKELAIHKATIGEIYRMSDEDPMLFDGIFGIGVSNHSVPSDYTPPVIAAHKQGLIADPIVTLWVNRSSAQNSKANTTVPSAGTLTVGGLNAQKCGKITEWHPIQPDVYEGDSEGGVYDQEIRLVLEKVSLGDVSVDVQSQMDADTTVINLISYDGRFNIIEASEESLTPIAKAAGAKLDDDKNVYRIACDATFPPLRLQFGSAEYLVQPKDFIRKWDGLDYCTLRLGILYSDSPVLGLLPSHCYSIDLAKKLMTFAPNLVA